MTETDKTWIKAKIKEADYNVYSVWKGSSKSGMTNYASFYITPEKGLIICVDFYIKELSVAKIDKKRECIKFYGDTFSVVYNLSIALYCNGKYNHDDAYKLKHRRL